MTIIREFKTAADGSEYVSDEYAIALSPEEMDAFREELDELVGLAIDRYEIEEG